MFHIHVLLAASLSSGYMAQPGTNQHQCGGAVREAAHNPCPAPNLPVQPLNGIVGPDLDPMFRRKVTVGQGFLNPGLHLFRRLRQLHCKGQ